MFFFVNVLGSLRRVFFNKVILSHACVVYSYKTLLQILKLVYITVLANLKIVFSDKFAQKQK